MSSAPNTVPTETNQSEGVLYSSVVEAAVQLTMPVGAQLGWDAYVRLLYERAGKAIQQQANTLLVRGNVTLEEARALVESQRNTLVREFRKPLTPWGRLYSELLKPSNSLPTLQKLVIEKGSIKAVLQSVGKSRVVVNRIAAVSRVAGPASVILSISFSAIAIQEAPADLKGRTAAIEAAGTVGALGLGIGGSWVGCLTGAKLASPSLVIPGWGLVTVGGACMLGGLAVGMGAGFAGDKLGRTTGGVIYDFVTSLSY